MTKKWEFQARGRGGILVLHDGLGERQIAYMEPAAPGHLIDTGRRIADLLTNAESPANPSSESLLLEVGRLREALEKIAKCSLAGFSLRGPESRDEIVALLLRFSNELAARVYIARSALNGGK